MSSSQAYQPPTGTQGSQQNTLAAPTMGKDEESQRMHYQCGDCGGIDNYRIRGPTRCQHCGGRVLYKLRTKRMIQFEAR